VSLGVKFKCTVGALHGAKHLVPCAHLGLVIWKIQHIYIVLITA
jgi:hypothetical protein